MPKRRAAVSGGTFANRSVSHSNYSIARLPDYQILLLALAVVLAVLAAGLRPDSFYGGDPGIKLIATRAALNTPSHPLTVPLPILDGKGVPHVEPFLTVHGGHAHAVTSPIFPVLSAPFLGLFGLRGLYVLPALGYLLSIAALVAFARATSEARSALSIATVGALSTPFLFYGLEFWEHMPAVACATLGAALFLNNRAWLSGLLIGLAALLRPEALWFSLAVLISAPLLAVRPTLRTYGATALAALITIAPYEAYVVAHFGGWVPPHLAINSGSVADGWMASRRALLQSWFGSAGTSSFWSVAPCAIGALAALFVPRRSDHRFLWSVVILDLSLTVITAPNDGGSQWGPRYLLLAYIPMSVLATDLIDHLPARGVAAIAMRTILIGGCIWIDRGAYRELRSTKINYGRIVDFVKERTLETKYVVTDIWWLDQVAASIDDRQFYYTPEEATGNAVVRRLSDQIVPTITVVRSTTESPDSSSWNTGTCYFEQRRDSTSAGNLVAIQLRHRCPQ